MAKPPSYTAKDLDALVSAREPADAVARLRRLAGAPAPPPELVISSVGFVGVRSGRPVDLDRGLPGWCACSALIELMPVAGDRDRGLFLLQALAWARADGLSAPVSFAGYPWTHDLGHDATMDDLDRSLEERAVSRFHGRLVPFVNEETRRKYGHRYLYARSCLDLARAGERHIVTGRTLRLAEAVRWNRTDETLYPLSHDFVHAPRDYAEAEALEAWHERVPGGLKGDNRGKKPALPEPELAELEAALLGEEREPLLDRVHALWGQGYSLEALGEAATLAAGGVARRGGPDEAAAARRIAFTDASAGAFPWLQKADGLIHVLMAALFVRQLGARASGERPAAEAPPGSADGLREALASGDRGRAFAEAAALAGADPARAVEVLATEAASRDASPERFHEPLAAVGLIERFRRSASSRRGEHLGTLAALLSAPAPRTLAQAWDRREA